MRKDSFQKLKKLIHTAQQIAIITHWSPDGDAMGSSLGFYHFLTQMGKKAKVIVPNDFPSFLDWLPSCKSVLNFEKDEVKVSKFIQKADLICTLDFNTLGRIEQLGQLIVNSKAPKLMVDHHREPEAYASHYFHDINSCSTCELIYELIAGLSGKKAIDKKIATCLYTGIMTDSGSFRFPSTTSKTHLIVADLIDKGANNSAIYNAVHDDNTWQRLKLLGYCLSEKMIVLSDMNCAYIYLSEKELDQFHYQKGDTEGVVNYPLSIRGIRFSVFFAERDGMIKISFRSKGNFDVNKFARKHFSGGGHKNAAGGKSQKKLDETIRDFMQVLALYEKELTHK